MSAVAAVRAAGGHIFFPVERHRSIAAPSADDGDAHFIHEHNCIVLLIYGSTGTSLYSADSAGQLESQQGNFFLV